MRWAIHNALNSTYNRLNPKSLLSIYNIVHTPLYCGMFLQEHCGNPPILRANSLVTQAFHRIQLRGAGGGNSPENNAYNRRHKDGNDRRQA